MRQLILGLLLNGLLAVSVVVSRAGTGLAALTGMLLGLCVFYGFGIGGMILLAAFVGPATTATWLRHRIRPLSASGGDSPCRTAWQVLANLGVAALCAIAALTWGHLACTLAFISAVGTALADTLSSELGQVFGRAPRMVTTFRPVAPGTDGAVTLAGLIDGTAGAAALALAAVPAMNLPFAYVWVIVLASTLGNLADSVIGALLPGRRAIENEITNFCATAVGALAGGVIALWL